ncbi:PepSY-associated TM helix domain-containing protein [Psychrobacter sp. DAB_AL62B]|uniref:PepSY-associated TM helix domain-containing protein n=1 Tax=Psychrobacter sp. DAB_AL62B TaxID=1028420 RepID=UPI002380CA55|nr:PepSY-associated TM helix domain-containing protein [Psychrobacter sp. DAB_AL62B]MDE4454945.1 PepSY domain-containing protein [Psychrobacter sp. DAB_AL62B]
MISSPFNLRHTCLWVHRYTGLAMAGFLIIAGVTGTLLAFHHELDEVFNHQLAYIDNQDTPQLPIAVLHDAVISAYPKHDFSSMPTSIEPDRSAVFTVDRVRDKGAKKQPKAQSKNQPLSEFQEVYVNPYNGHIVGTRDKDEWAWRNTMYKVFWLHRDLLLGDIGKLILGIVALVWTINCFIGFYLTFPRAVKNSNKNNKAKNKQTNKKRASFFKRWLPAWKIRTKSNIFKLNYDLHHAFGLWLWLILLVIAWSSVGFNLKQVYQPVMQAVVGLEGREEKSSKFSKPSAQSVSDAKPFNDAANAADMVTKANSIAYLSRQADIAAQKNGVEIQQLLGIRWVEEDNQWQMRFKTNKDIGKKGGASSITVHAKTGSVERVNFGYQSSFGSKVDQWLSTLHMGHISYGLGHLLYQIFLAVIGLAVIILSATGVYLWWKGRQQRLKMSRDIKKSIINITDV